MNNVSFVNQTSGARNIRQFFFFWYTFLGIFALWFRGLELKLEVIALHE